MSKINTSKIKTCVQYSELLKKIASNPSLHQEIEVETIFLQLSEKERKEFIQESLKMISMECLFLMEATTLKNGFSTEIMVTDGSNRKFLFSFNEVILKEESSTKNPLLN